MGLNCGRHGIQIIIFMDRVSYDPGFNAKAMKNIKSSLGAFRVGGTVGGEELFNS